jgi:hypothetical protein
MDGQFYDESTDLTYIVIGEESQQNGRTSFRNGRELGLRRLVTNVIAITFARWRHKNIKSPVSSLFIVRSIRNDRSDEDYNPAMMNCETWD